MSTVNEAQSSAAHIENRLQFETLISDVSSRFHQPARRRSGPGDRGRAAPCLRALGVDLAVLWQWSLVSPAVVSPTHVYCAATNGALRADAPGAGPLESGTNTDGPHDCHFFAWGHTGGGRSRPRILPPAWHQVGFVPAALVGGRAAFGALGFNALQAECDWPDTLVTQVQLVAEVFANALARSATSCSCSAARRV